MGNSQSIQKINFEDVQTILKNHDSYLLIHTLDGNEQDCLIPYTISANQEETVINQMMKMGKKGKKIMIYGKHCNDEKIYKKYDQLTSLGFYDVSLYCGGIFEWLLLQDIYGENEFPTTIKELDLLRFKPSQRIGISLLEY
jgi:hypothetical protein